MRDDHLATILRFRRSAARAEYEITANALAEVERHLLRIQNEPSCHDPDLDPLLLPAVRSLRAKVEARLSPGP